jgi:hypothetical protein
MWKRLIIVLLIAFAVSCASDPAPRAPAPPIPASAFTWSGAVIFVNDAAYNELDVTFNPSGASTSKSDPVLQRLGEEGRLFSATHDDWLVKTGGDVIRGHQVLRVRFVAGPHTGQTGLTYCESCTYWTKPNEP